MAELTHQRIADAATTWLSKPFARLVVQELSTISWASHFNPQHRMDVVAVIPNAKRVIVIECKASQADFKRGFEKLGVYRDYCHQLYIAAPRGMITSREELPKGVGLLEVGRSARRKYAPATRDMDSTCYSLMLERVLQKIIVLRGQGPAWAITRYLQQQRDEQELAFQDWLRENE